MPKFDIKAFLQTLSQRAGVYRMYSADNELLYVGKAKNLKNRVSSYFRSRGLNTKTVALVSHINHIEATITANEAEALLLEQTLIKEHRPPYNILLKDDKSYPYIYLSDHSFPSITYLRGKRKKAGRYFGPYPNSHAVKETLSYLQRIFKIRDCTDSYFSNRSRACLQYEIGRCTAPCVGLVTQHAYKESIRQAELFLTGKSVELSQQLQHQMLKASDALEFEKAAELRDQIELIQQVQESQNVYADGSDADIWAIIEWQNIYCIHRLSFRQGRLLGSKHFYPKNLAGETEQELLLTFISQYYLNGMAPDGLPKDIIVDLNKDEVTPLLEAIRIQQAKKPSHSRGVRGQPRIWLQMAKDNARAGVQAKISGHQAAKQKLQAVADLLKLPEAPTRIECFDVSHSQGEAAYASCVVYDEEGLNKKRYRRFSIKDDVTAGDDYAALEQAIRRHLIRCIDQNDLPSILLIDGGKGQVGRIHGLVKELGIDLYLLGISKGVTRKSGWEFLWEAEQKQPIMPDAHNEGFQLLQLVRDEAHRFAITGHRKARAKSRSRSALEDISGVGAKRRKELLLYFGSLNNMRRASQEEIAKVPGISHKLAEHIFQQLHGQ